MQHPIWDSVLKATTFLKSFSNIAIILATPIVNPPKIKKIKIKRLFNKKKQKFINKDKPAVTKVLLCTKDLTGVGALIALGNHPEKGNCALFVKEVINKKK